MADLRALNLVTAPADYRSDACTIENEDEVFVAARLQFSAGVWFQVLRAGGNWEPEEFMGAVVGTLRLGPCHGVRVRSALATAPAQVSVRMLTELELGAVGGENLSAPTYTVTPSGGLTPLPGGGGAMTGDYKISAQPATHSDGGTGTWYLCDGTTFPVSEAALIGLVGASAPDARGRTLSMLGTNAAVNAIGKNDGVALGSRRPHHRHTPHTHTLGTQNQNLQAGSGGGFFNSSVQPTGAADGGSGVATDSLDAPAFVVPGNLFIHS